ncbi:ABC transporter substrate-binding protein [Blastococcus deserti]|uniref:ABC transporter substrate-binding protein n=1 Tax=Blastococcus deserti TaxID=2259033 RepID=A0ABW4XGL6_9ACTN
MSVTTGCGGGSGSGDEGGSQVITIWDQEQSAKDIAEGYAGVVEQFEEAHPGVTVKVETFPFAQYRDKMLVAMKGGTGPDVMTLDQVWTPEFAAAGLIAPLDDRIGESDVIKEDDFFEGAWQSNQYDDQMWGVPLNFDVWEQMYYNADLFRAAGLDPDNPPKTWSEWNDAAAKLNQPPNSFGIGLIGCKDETSSVLTDSFIFSNGGEILDESGDVVFDSPENVEAFEQYQTLLQYSPAGSAGACEQDVVNQFTAGKAAMILDGSWQQDTMKNAAQFDWRIALPPAPDGKEFVGALGGWNLAVNAKSENQDLAFELIETLSQPENQAAVNSLIPALQSAGEQFVNENRQQPEVILAALAGGRPRPASPVYPQLSQVQQAAVQEIIGGADVKSVLTDAAKQMQEIIDTNS